MWKMLYLQSAGRERVVFASYVVGDRLIEDELAAKMAGLVGRVVGPRMLGAIAVSTECVPNCVIASQRLQVFIESSLPIMHDALVQSMRKSAGNRVGRDER